MERFPSDYSMFQPRLGIAYDVKGDGRQVHPGQRRAVSTPAFRGSISPAAGAPTARGARSLFRNSELTGILGPPPAYGELLPEPGWRAVPARRVRVRQGLPEPADLHRDDRVRAGDASGVCRGLDQLHPRAHRPPDPVLQRQRRGVRDAHGAPGCGAGGNGIGDLTVVQSTAKSRYNGITAELRRTSGKRLQFQLNYTLAFDKSDDDNERDPFTFRYARADSLEKEYNWSDRDQRHRVNAWVLAILPGDIYFNNRLSAYSAQPASEICGPGNWPPTGERAATPAQRICPDGTSSSATPSAGTTPTSLGTSASRSRSIWAQGTLEAIIEAFNVTNSDNFKDPASGGTFLNFDGTIRSGLGEPRQFQAGLRYLF